MVVIVLGDGAKRFSEIRTAVDGISGKVLTDTLRTLVRDGLVERRVYAEVPPRVEYELTPLGRTLHAPLQALGQWAEQHIVEVLAARDAYDDRVEGHQTLASPPTFAVGRLRPGAGLASRSPARGGTRPGRGVTPTPARRVAVSVAAAPRPAPFARRRGAG